MKDPRLSGRDVSWLWSWIAAKDGNPVAGPFTAVLTVVALTAAVALTFIPFTVTVAAAKVLFLAPLPAALLIHVRGRRGVWSVTAIVIAAIPYAILLASSFGKPASHHIPL